MNVSGEISQSLFGIVRPRVGQEMVKVDVDNDASKATAVGGEKLLTLEEDGVGIGEVINRAMEEDALNEIFRIVLEQVLGSSADEVAKQGADTGGVGWLCEMEMSKEVQSL